MKAHEHPVRRRALYIALAWVALLALMLASLASAYVPLGPWNLWAGVAIATVKSLIVLVIFMGLLRAPPLLRIVAGLGFSTLLILFALSGIDYATRVFQPSAMQRPQQLHQAFPGGPTR